MDIDSIYQDILTILRSQGKIVDISKTLSTITSNNNRVLYVYDAIEILNALPELTKVHKCQKVSTYYRHLGNKVFSKSDDYEAWQHYNLSLLYAPCNTDSYTLALANRSAVFFSLKKYEECLRDINRVFTLKYPDNLKGKLEKRRQLCVKALNNVHKSQTDDNWHMVDEILSLKGSRDDKYVCASSKLQVVVNEEMGRHVIAKEDIKVGEVLAVEDPYLVLLLKNQYLFYCSYCLSRAMNLFPCNNCCYTLYCSKDCKKKAFQEYHKVECPLMATLLHMNFSKLELLALRVVIKARYDHEDWKSLLHTITKADSTVHTNIRGHVEVDGKWVYDSKYYASIHTLASNQKQRTVSDLFQKSVSAAILLHLLSIGTDFLMSDKDTEGEEIRRCAAGLLLLHIMTGPTNMHGITSNIENADGLYIDETNIACAPYAFHSLLNHSCAPNVVRYCKLGTARMTLFALRPIKKGMQLFDNYGSHHAMETRQSRRETLSYQYKFICQCEACVEDWPIYSELKSARKLPGDTRQRKDNLLNTETIIKLKTGDKKTAIDLFNPLCELMEALDCYGPCIELADCQETMKQCLVILEGLVSYGYGKLIQWNALPPTC